MLRTHRWFLRELDRQTRLHAAELERERAAFTQERGRLIDTICHLAGRPTPTVSDDTAAEFALEPEQPSALDEPDGLGFLHEPRFPIEE